MVRAPSPGRALGTQGGMRVRLGRDTGLFQAARSSSQLLRDISWCISALEPSHQSFEAVHLFLLFFCFIWLVLGDFFSSEVAFYKFHLRVSDFPLKPVVFIVPLSFLLYLEPNCSGMCSSSGSV